MGFLRRLHKKLEETGRVMMEKVRAVELFPGSDSKEQYVARLEMERRELVRAMMALGARGMRPERVIELVDWRVGEIHRELERLR